ncbi:hypothetical protein DH2020_003876 [Rehmannia glutinosa]|uniref:RING-type domain-containing protein n=1 Tax=Rehmannia glutinosa TaxID=99300 RepID=A0ABR0XMW2_REHGL
MKRGEVMMFAIEVFQAEKESVEAEVRNSLELDLEKPLCGYHQSDSWRWRQEIKEKEKRFALLAEETRIAEIRKANSRSELLILRQKLEIESQLARDEHQRLEDELSRRMPRQMSGVPMDDDNFLYDDIEITSLESNVPGESSSSTHWNNMICTHNQVSVVLLPCTHQVLCKNCYEAAVETHCPYCKADIEQGIKVYGPAS